MQVYCGSCDCFREVSEKEIRRLDRGDIEFVCEDCRTRNRNHDAKRRDNE